MGRDRRYARGREPRCFLILELDTPYEGAIVLSDEPLRLALEQLGEQARRTGITPAMIMRLPERRLPVSDGLL